MLLCSQRSAAMEAVSRACHGKHRCQMSPGMRGLIAVQCAPFEEAGPSVEHRTRRQPQALAALLCTAHRTAAAPSCWPGGPLVTLREHLPKCNGKRKDCLQKEELPIASLSADEVPPAMVVGADEDPIVDRQDCEALAQALHTEQLLWLEGAGHDVMLDVCWPKVAAALVDFARSVAV